MKDKNKKFKAKPWRAGNSWVISLPIQYINNEIINPEKEYWFTIKEVENGEFQNN